MLDRPTALTEEERVKCDALSGWEPVLPFLAIIRRLDERVLDLQGQHTCTHCGYVAVDQPLGELYRGLLRERDALRAVAKAADTLGYLRKRIVHLGDHVGYDVGYLRCEAVDAFNDALAALDRAMPGWRDG